MTVWIESFFTKFYSKPGFKPRLTLRHARPLVHSATDGLVVAEWVDVTSFPLSASEECHQGLVLISLIG